MTARRQFLSLMAAGLAAPFIGRPVLAATAGRPLPIPDLVEPGSGRTELAALAGLAGIAEGGKTPVLGFSRPYLGPTLRLRRGQVAELAVANRLEEPVTCHWHGLHVPAVLEGGPALQIGPGQTWNVSLPVDQPAATLWYHSHIHRRTADHVYYGLAGLLLIDDPAAGDEGLPVTYGVDDLPLIIQDRAFEADGSFFYLKRGPALTHGYLGNVILVNGAIAPTAGVPAGLVRLRLLNGSNARIYDLRFSDDRIFYQIASDGGLLQRPVARTGITLAPGERGEFLVDFSDRSAVALLGASSRNLPPSGGMMREMSRYLLRHPPQSQHGEWGEFDVVHFAPDPSLPVRVRALPSALASAPGPLDLPPVRNRSFKFDIFRSGSGTGPGTRTGASLHKMSFMGINDVAFDDTIINHRLRQGEAEIWTIRAPIMAHPFHVHGLSFQVLSRNGDPVDFATEGLKDVTLVRGTTEILLAPMHPASDAVPFMYHCHILEHEDSGMMGQFTVTA